MQSWLFRKVRVYDREGPHDGKVVDLLVSSAAINVNPSEVPHDATIVEQAGLCVSRGWADFGTGVGDPGFETRETLASVQRAGAAGGFTHLCLQPNSLPVTDDRTSVEALLSRTASGPIEVSVLAAMSQGQQGEALAELGDLSAAGVRFFGDGLRPVADAKLMQLALAYTKPLGGTVVAQPGNRRLSFGAQVNEGQASMHMGVTGFPDIAEEIGLVRDLHLQAYTQGRLHVMAPSLASSVERLVLAKAEEAGVSFGVSAQHLLQDETAVSTYDVNAKLLPPLRTADDRERLQDSIRRGEADVLVSLHRPYDRESKLVEFGYASFGASTLEHTFALALTAIDEVAPVVDYLSRRNRVFLNLDTSFIEDGAARSLTFFAPDDHVTVPASPKYSLAAFQAAGGLTLRGRVAGVFAKGHFLPT